MAEQRHFAIRIKVTGGERRWWSGFGDLTLNGQVYEGTYIKAADGTEGSAIALTAPENVAGEVGNRCQFVISVADETIRRAYSVDVGVVDCDIYWIYPRLTSLAGNFSRNARFNIAGTAFQSIASLLRSQLTTATIGNLTTTPRQWNSHAGGSTVSGQTGPGGNNTRFYIYYETSSNGHFNSPANSLLTIDGGTQPAADVQAWLAHDGPRRVRLNLCLMGAAFNRSNNGLYLWSSADDPNFSSDFNTRQTEVRNLYRQQVHGWNFRDNWLANQTVTDYGGNSFTVTHAGGWREVTLDVPEGHRYVGLAADIHDTPSGSTSFTGDSAISDIILESAMTGTRLDWITTDEFSGQLSAPVLDPNAGTYTADVEGEFGRFGKGRVIHWSDVAQRTLTRGFTRGVDLGLQDAEQIRRGEVRFIW